jgi:hypothetical protein
MVAGQRCERHLRCFSCRGSGHKIIRSRALNTAIRATLDVKATYHDNKPQAPNTGEKALLGKRFMKSEAAYYGRFAEVNLFTGRYRKAISRPAQARRVISERHILDCRITCDSFSWRAIRSEFGDLLGDWKLIIAHETGDRHADGPRSEELALRMLRLIYIAPSKPYAAPRA